MLCWLTLRVSPKLREPKRATGSSRNRRPRAKTSHALASAHFPQFGKIDFQKIKKDLVKMNPSLRGALCSAHEKAREKAMAFDTIETKPVRVRRLAWFHLAQRSRRSSGAGSCRGHRRDVALISSPASRP